MNIKEKILVTLIPLYLIASVVLMLISQATGNPVCADIGAIMLAIFGVSVMVGLIIEILR